MSSKTPYEIRLEVLRMAQSLVVDEFHIKRETLLRQWDSAVESAHRKGEDGPKMLDMPTFPTENDILYTASRLIEFVNNKT